VTSPRRWASRRAAPVALLLAGVASLTACQPSPPASPRVAAFAKLPDWSGLWEPNVFVGEGIGQSLSAEGLKNGAPILGAKMPFNAEWQAKFAGKRFLLPSFKAAILLMSRSQVLKGNE